MLAAGDTAKKVILKVGELINIFITSKRAALCINYYDNKNAPVTFVNSTGALTGLIFVQELCGIGHCFWNTKWSYQQITNYAYHANSKVNLLTDVLLCWFIVLLLSLFLLLFLQMAMVFDQERDGKNNVLP